MFNLVKSIFKTKAQCARDKTRIEKDIARAALRSEMETLARMLKTEGAKNAAD